MRTASRQHGSFYPQLKLARLWLPALIVAVVLAWQFLVVPLGGQSWRFWSNLLFYSILGPAVTFVVLDWIATEVKLREEAQARLSSLYAELQDSHELLAGIQQVTESFAASTDLEATLAAAGRGITRVAGAVGAFVNLDVLGVQLTDTFHLPPPVARLAVELQDRYSDSPQQLVRVDGKEWWVLSNPVVWGGRRSGVLQGWYSQPADARQQEAFSIIASEFSGAAEAAGARMRDLTALVAVDRSMRAEGNLSRLLDLLLKSMTERTHARVAGIYLAEEGGLLHLAAVRGTTQPAQPLPIVPGTGVLGSVARERETLLDNRIADRQGAANESVLLADAGSVLVLPLQSDGMLLGLIILVHPEPDHFAASGIPLLELMAGQVSWAVRNARAYLHSEELAIAEERARIAREIHDGVAQSLAFSALKLDLVERLMEKEPAKAAAELAVTRSTIRELIKEVRRSIFALRPVDLERHGFTETIRRYTLDFGQQNDVQVEAAIGETQGLTLRSETILFRIFQEAMNNVAKHAQARTVRVEVGTNHSGAVFICVSDDGIGFDKTSVGDRVSSMGGLGLRQMRERVLAQGGSLQISTEPGKGTSVYAELPA